MKTVIHVNRHIIDRNRREGRRDAPLSVRDYKKLRTADTVEIVDDTGQVVCKIVHRPEKPLGCGAKVWIETQLEVRTSS